MAPVLSLGMAWAMGLGLSTLRFGIRLRSFGLRGKETLKYEVNFVSFAFLLISQNMNFTVTILYYLILTVF